MRPSAVSNWLRRVHAGGVAALHTQRHQTRKRAKLTSDQQQQLLQLLQAGAEAHGEIGARWTGKRVAALVKREFGVVYHAESVPRLLRTLGWTPQKPVTQASQRDEATITQFKADWDAVKKGHSASNERLCG